MCWPEEPELENGGAERDRTVDLLNAIQALSQLSYSPTRVGESAKGSTGPRRGQTQGLPGDGVSQSANVPSPAGRT